MHFLGSAEAGGTYSRWAFDYAYERADSSVVIEFPIHTVGKPSMNWVDLKLMFSIVGDPSGCNKSRTRDLIMIVKFVK